MIVVEQFLCVFYHYISTSAFCFRYKSLQPQLHCLPCNAEWAEQEPVPNWTYECKNRRPDVFRWLAHASKKKRPIVKRLAYKRMQYLGRCKAFELIDLTCGKLAYLRGWGQEPNGKASKSLKRKGFHNDAGKLRRCLAHLGCCAQQ
jgi:hypothetical protein